MRGSTQWLSVLRAADHDNTVPFAARIAASARPVVETLRLQPSALRVEIAAQKAERKPETTVAD